MDFNYDLPEYLAEHITPIKNTAANGCLYIRDERDQVIGKVTNVIVNNETDLNVIFDFTDNFYKNLEPVNTRVGFYLMLDPFNNYYFVIKFTDINLPKILENFKLKIKDRDQFDHLLNQCQLPRLIDFNYKRNEIEKQYPFLKDFWAFGSNLYSYSSHKINDFLGVELLKRDDAVTPFLLNFIIWDVINR